MELVRGLCTICSNSSSRVLKQIPEESFECIKFIIKEEVPDTIFKPFASALRLCPTCIHHLNVISSSKEALQRELQSKDNTACILCEATSNILVVALDHWKTFTNALEDVVEYSLKGMVSVCTHCCFLLNTRYSIKCELYKKFPRLKRTPQPHKSKLTPGKKSPRRKSNNENIDLRPLENISPNTHTEPVSANRDKSSSFVDFKNAVTEEKVGEPVQRPPEINATQIETRPLEQTLEKSFPEQSENDLLPELSTNANIQITNDSPKQSDLPTQEINVSQNEATIDENKPPDEFVSPPPVVSSTPKPMAIRKKVQSRRRSSVLSLKSGTSKHITKTNDEVLSDSLNNNDTKLHSYKISLSLNKIKHPKSFEIETSKKADKQRLSIEKHLSKSKKKIQVYRNRKLLFKKCRPLSALKNYQFRSAVKNDDKFFRQIPYLLLYNKKCRKDRAPKKLSIFDNIFNKSPHSSKTVTENKDSKASEILLSKINADPQTEKITARRESKAILKEDVPVTKKTEPHLNERSLTSDVNAEPSKKSPSHPFQKSELAKTPTDPNKKSSHESSNHVQHRSKSVSIERETSKHKSDPFKSPTQNTPTLNNKKIGSPRERSKCVLEQEKISSPKDHDRCKNDSSFKSDPVPDKFDSDKSPKPSNNLNKKIHHSDSKSKSIEKKSSHGKTEKRSEIREPKSKTKEKHKRRRESSKHSKTGDDKHEKKNHSQQHSSTKVDHSLESFQPMCSEIPTYESTQLKALLLEGWVEEGESVERPSFPLPIRSNTSKVEVKTETDTPEKVLPCDSNSPEKPDEPENSITEPKSSEFKTESHRKHQKPKLKIKLFSSKEKTAKPKVEKKKKPILFNKKLVVKIEKLAASTVEFYTNKLEHKHENKENETSKANVSSYIHEGITDIIQEPLANECTVSDSQQPNKSNIQEESSGLDFKQPSEEKDTSDERETTEIKLKKHSIKHRRHTVFEERHDDIDNNKSVNDNSIRTFNETVSKTKTVKSRRNTISCEQKVSKHVPKTTNLLVKFAQFQSQCRSDDLSPTSKNNASPIVDGHTSNEIDERLNKENYVEDSRVDGQLNGLQPVEEASLIYEQQMQGVDQSLVNERFTIEPLLENASKLQLDKRLSMEEALLQKFETPVKQTIQCIDERLQADQILPDVTESQAMQFSDNVLIPNGNQFVKKRRRSTILQDVSEIEATLNGDTCPQLEPDDPLNLDETSASEPSEVLNETAANLKRLSDELILNDLSDYILIDEDESLDDSDNEQIPATQQVVQKSVAQRNSDLLKIKTELYPISASASFDSIATNVDDLKTDFSDKIVNDINFGKLIDEVHECFSNSEAAGLNIEPPDDFLELHDSSEDLLSELNSNNSGEYGNKEDLLDPLSDLSQPIGNTGLIEYFDTLNESICDNGKKRKSETNRLEVKKVRFCDTVEAYID